MLPCEQTNQIQCFFSPVDDVVPYIVILTQFEHFTLSIIVCIVTSAIALTNIAPALSVLEFEL